MGLRHQQPGQTYEEFKATMTPSRESSASFPTPEADSPDIDIPGIYSPGVDSPPIGIPGPGSPNSEANDAFLGVFVPPTIRYDSPGLQGNDTATMSDSDGEEHIMDDEYFLNLYWQITSIRYSLGTRATPHDIDLYQARTRSQTVSSELEGVRQDITQMLRVLYRSRWNQLLAVGRVDEFELDPRNRVTQRRFDDVILDMACISHELAQAPNGQVPWDEMSDVRNALDRLYGQPGLAFFQLEIMQEATPEVIDAFNRRSREMVRYLEHHSYLNTPLIRQCDEIINSWLQPIMERRRVAEGTL